MKKNKQDFLQSATDFIQRDNESLRKLNKIYLIFAFVSLILAILLVITLVLLMPLKKVEPYLIRVDNNTGKTDILTVLPNVKKTYGEVINQHFLSEYVKYRESYDWERISDYYAATKLMSNSIVEAQYIKLYGKDNANSPVNTLRNDYRILIKINSISYIGQTAQIRFTKTKIPTINHDNTSGQDYHYLATVNFIYQNKEMTSKQRMVNPLGFTVTSYEVTNDDFY